MADGTVVTHSNVWPWVWWIVNYIFLPVSVPLMLCKFISECRYHLWKKSMLQGKTVLITGASSGLGEALSHAFYSAGCRVILAARREEELKRVRDDILNTALTVKPTCPPVVTKLDLEDLNMLPEKVKSLIQLYGKIDILVNNGGISYRGDIITTNIDVDIKVMVINYFGQVALTKAVLPFMLERNAGHIVAVSSVQGRMAIPFRSAYSASKHALQAFCDTLRAEVSDHNIKVTVVSPGYIQTNLSLNAVTGSGSTYGVMDATTASGMLPNQVAERIVQAVIKEEKEVILAGISPSVAIWLRTLFPSLYFFIMKKRAQRLKSLKAKDN